MKRANLIIATELFIGSFILYIRTLAPSLLYGDSAEFQTIAYTLGVGHPTGYPVYVLLAKLFTLIPVGEIAYRVNLFSAFCAALTVGLVYLILRKLGAQIIPSICGALVLALTSQFWKYASMAEIYALAAVCLAFILFAVFQWKETKSPRWLFFAGLAGGLSLGIHTTIALSGVSILVYLILSTRQRTDWLQALLGSCIGVVLFISSFLLLDSLNSSAGYYNAVVRPSLSVWGMTPENFDSPFERLAFLYFPPQFRGQLFDARIDEIALRFHNFIDESEPSMAFAVLGLISLSPLPYKLSSAHWQEAILLAVAILLFFGFAITYAVDDFYVYYIPVMLLLSILIGLGLNAIVELAGLVFHTLPVVPVGLSILILIIGFSSVADKVSSQWRERIPPGLEDWEEYFFLFPENRKFEAEQTVNRLEDNAVVFTDWDTAYSFYYVAHVLQGRTGMSFHETFPQEGVTRFADSAIEYIDENIDSRPIYFSERPSQLGDRFRITRAGSGLFQLERK